MTPRIEMLKDKKLVGKSLAMSFSNFRVAELWQNFIPRRKEITNAVSSDLISMSVYKPGHFTELNPEDKFDKWAAVEVKDFNTVPDGMEAFILPGGLYAVFDYKGPGNDNTIFEYIHRIWLPTSGYELDDRPHFEILGSKYRNNDPASEEEIWIPIRTPK